MSGWRKVRRLDAGGDGAKEKQLQAIFDEWKESSFLAGVPEWLWSLPKPSRPSIDAFGYKATLDAYWGDVEPRTVAELKYGKKFEPFAVAEVLHYAYVLRLQYKGEQIRSVVVSQQNYAIRAAVTQISGVLPLQHIEADLLSVDKKTILWLSCPHARLHKVDSLPTDFPLKRDWTSLRWFSVEEESTWVAYDGKSEPPFIDGSVAMISRFRTSCRYKWILWVGTLPAFNSRWSTARWNTAGKFWIWDEETSPSHLSSTPSW